MVFLLALFVILTKGNFIQNGDFQDPHLPTQQLLVNGTMVGWIGFIDVVGPLFYPSLSYTTQFVSIASSGLNGWISQIVNLPSNGIYKVSFYVDSDTTNRKAELYWSGELIATFSSVYRKQIFMEYQFEASKGPGQLKFVQIGEQNGQSVLIDDVSMELIIAYPQLSFLDSSLSLQIGVSLLALFPLNQLTGLRYLILFLSDLSMYIYDKREYKGAMWLFLYNTNNIEVLQLFLARKYMKLSIDSSAIPTTNLTNYSNQKHMEIDGVDDSFFRGIYLTLIFGLFPAIVIGFSFERIFVCLRSYKFSVYLRRYYFLICVLLQGFVESNIAFFTYLFFQQAKLLFSYKFVDRAFASMSIVFFYVVLMVACSFYFIMNSQLRKRFGYFIYCFYRCFPSMLFLTLNSILKGLARGVISSCLHNDYGAQIILLCVINVLIMSSAVWIEKKYNIFMSKTMFTLFLLYHFAFILLNIALYAEKALRQGLVWNELANTFVMIQNCVIWSILSLVLIEFLLDFVPYNFLHPHKSQSPTDTEQVKSTNTNLNIFENRSQISDIKKSSSQKDLNFSLSCKIQQSNNQVQIISVGNQNQNRQQQVISIFVPQNYNETTRQRKNRENKGKFFSKIKY